MRKNFKFLSRGWHLGVPIHHCFRFVGSNSAPVLTNQSDYVTAKRSVDKDAIKFDSGSDKILNERLSGSRRFVRERDKIFRSVSTPQIHNVLTSVSNLDISVYTAAIKQCGKLQDTDYCCQIMDMIQKRKVLPDIIVYTTLFHAFNLNRKMDLCDRYLDEMINVHRITPNIVVATSLLSGCTFKGDIHRAHDIWKQIILKYDLQPNQMTYGTMIEICGQVGDVGMAREYYEEMRQDPTVEVDCTISRNQMINAYVKNNYIEEALQLKREFEDTGSHLDEVGYAHLIKFYLKETAQADPNRALDLIEECMEINALERKSEAMISMTFVAVLKLLRAETDKDRKREYFEIMQTISDIRKANGFEEWDRESARHVLDAHLIYYSQNFESKETVSFFESKAKYIGYWSIPKGFNDKKWAIDLHGYNYDQAKFVLHYLLRRKRNELSSTMGSTWRIICGRRSGTMPSSKSTKIGLSQFIVSRLKSAYKIRAEVSKRNSGVLVLNVEDVKQFLQKQEEKS